MPTSSPTPAQAHLVTTWFELGWRKRFSPYSSLETGVVDRQVTRLCRFIDLGYVKQQATSYNSTYHFYHFSNIRYAAPPLGDLRFRKPQTPLPQDGIQNGDIPFAKSAGVQTFPPVFGLPGIPPGSDLGVEDCLVSLLTLIQFLLFFPYFPFLSF